jgi:hypothetical protein
MIHPVPHKRFNFVAECGPLGAPGSIVFVDHGVPFPQRPSPDLRDCLASRPDGKPWLLFIWEPLHTKAPSPPKAAPFCCYARTVIFYHFPHILRLGRRYWRHDGKIKEQKRSFEEWDKVETRLTWDNVVEFEGERFEIGSGTVRWAHRRWWMLVSARRVQNG